MARHGYWGELRLTVSVIEDAGATARWRWRTAAGWAGAAPTVVAGVAAAAAWGWQSSGVNLLVAALLAGVAYGAGWLLLRGWRRWVRPPDGLATWRAALPTPVGPRAGWALRRPDWLSNQDRIGALAAATAIAAVAAGSAVTTGTLVAATGGVFAVPAAAVLIRRLARVGRFPPGMAITADGPATADGLLNWDSISEVRVVGNRSRRRVRLVVAGRRRPVTVDGGDCAMPADQLAELIERYRREPRQRHALGGAGGASWASWANEASGAGAWGGRR
jgi:hypothetical protein